MLKFYNTKVEMSFNPEPLKISQLPYRDQLGMLCGLQLEILIELIGQCSMIASQGSYFQPQRHEYLVFIALITNITVNSMIKLNIYQTTHNIQSFPQIHDLMALYEYSCPNSTSSEKSQTPLEYKSFKKTNSYDHWRVHSRNCRLLSFGSSVHQHLATMLASSAVKQPILQYVSVRATLQRRL